MKKAKITLWAALTFTFSIFYLNLSQIHLSSTGMETTKITEQNHSDYVLQATVLISMYGFRPAEEQAAGITFTIAESARTKGLGTLVAYDGQQLIVTHDHWSLANSELELVQFHNTQKELVAQITGSEFIKRIRYRDGGTMVLSAPAVFDSSVKAVPWHDSHSIGRGAIVQVVHRKGFEQGGIGIGKAMVEAVEVTNGIRYFMLRSVDGHAIVRGDSGGGIWYEGELVGNIWLSLVVRVKEKGESGEAMASSRMESNWSQVAVLTESIQDQLTELPEQPYQPANVDGGAKKSANVTHQLGLPPASQNDGIH